MPKDKTNMMELSEEELVDLLSAGPMVPRSDAFVDRVMQELTVRDGKQRRSAGLDFDFTIAFQPIVSNASRKIVAHEALVRGLNNEPAARILGRIDPTKRHRFDQACRIKAVQLAIKLGMDSHLSVNFLPHVTQQSRRVLEETMEAARSAGFPLNRLILEISAKRSAINPGPLRDLVHEYKSAGVRTAFDDFGGDHTSLKLLGDCQADQIKLDMALVRGIDHDRGRQAVVKGIVETCRALSLDPIAKGVETYEEFSALKDLGVELFQGFYFAKPAVGSLATVPAAAYC